MRKRITGMLQGGWVWHALAWLLPALLLLLAYAALGVFPFGDKSLLLVDMDNEYIDYFAHLSRTLREGGSFLRSWNMGMGLNLVGLIAFYTGSPLNLLVYLVPVEWITEAVLALTLVKVGLCGLTFHLSARRMFPALPRALALAFSVAYALSGYTLAYSSNIMWLDGVFCLPLVVLLVERMLRTGKWGLLAGTLIWVFLSSYYIGYMVGVFTFLYLTAAYFSKHSAPKGYLLAVGRLVLAAAVAAGCLAFLLLPAFFELQEGQTSLWSFSASPAPAIPLSALSAKLLPGSYDSLTDAGLPNLYAGLAGVLGAALFFTAKGSSRREKIAFGALLSFLLFSFSCELLDLAWHAFEDPTWFPARYSFVLSFLLLHLAMRALSRDGLPTPARVIGAAAVPCLLFLEAGIQGYRFLTWKMVLAGILLLLLYAALLLLRRRFGGRRASAVLAALFLLLTLSEALWHSHRMVQGMEEQFRYKTRASYHSFRERYAPAVEAAALLEAQDGSPARTELIGQRNANGGMALGYRGLSHYSTTTDQALNLQLRRLGYNTGTINEVRFAETTPVTNGLLAVRYLLSPDDPGPGYELADTAGEIGVWRNTAAFPIAFLAGEDALRFHPDNPDAFARQNEWIASLHRDNAEVFAPLEVAEIRLENAVREEHVAYTEYTRISSSSPAVIEYHVRNPGGQPAYAHLPVYRRTFVNATAYVDGTEFGRELSYRHNTVIPLGSGEEIVLRLEVASGTILLEQEQFYRLDLAAARDASARAWENAVEFSRFDDTRVEGTVSAPEGGVLVTTFPCDSGWTVKVDGTQVPAETFAEVFLAVPLPPGEHEIAMRYSPPGFRAGCIISAATVLLWAGGVIGVRQYRRKKA